MKVDPRTVVTVVSGALRSIVPAIREARARARAKRIEQREIRDLLSHGRRAELAVKAAVPELHRAAAARPVKFGGPMYLLGGDRSGSIVSLCYRKGKIRTNEKSHGAATVYANFWSALAYGGALNG